MNRGVDASARAVATARLLVPLLVAGLLLGVAGVSSAARRVDPVPVVTRMSLPTSDLVYDAASNRLYASVPSRAGVLGNRVVALDPASGAVLGSVFVGSEPGKLALSDDGSTLYVALDGPGAVRRVALPSLVAGAQFSLGAGPISGPYFVGDIEVLPGDRDAVAISRRGYGNPSHQGVVVYDGGVKRVKETVRTIRSDAIEFGTSASRLYGFETGSSVSDFARMDVDSTGVSVADVTTDLITRAGDIELADGRIYATNGQVVDPDSLARVGTFALGSGGEGPLEPDGAGTVYFVSSGSLKSFDEDTFTPIASVPIAGISGTPSSLVKAGDGRLAFRTSGDQVFFVHFQTDADTTPPSIGLGGPLAATATEPGGAHVSFSASASDGGSPVPVTCSPSSGSLFPVGTSTVVCTATDAAGNGNSVTQTVTVARAAPSYDVLSLQVNDLVFDTARHVLYASVPSTAGTFGNRVVAIDPASGDVVDSVAVGSEPARLALSADGGTLWVALDGAAAVRRVDLPSFTAGLQFSLGADPRFGPYLVQDMEVLPGDADAVAISRRNSGSSDHAGVAIYDDGVQRGTTTPRGIGSNVIAFGTTADRLYGVDTQTSEGGFRRMDVTASGVSVADLVVDLVGPDIEFSGGRIFGTAGHVVDPASSTLVGRFVLPSAGPVEPDGAGTVWFVSSGMLRAFDRATFTPLQSFPLPALAGNPASLVATGGGDLAFRTTGGQVVLVHQSDTIAPELLLPAQSPVAPATGPGGAAVGFAAGARDDFDPAPQVACTPAAGSVFPIGTTTVSCTANDAHGNAATATFGLTVLGAREQIAALGSEVAAAAELDNRDARLVRTVLLDDLAAADAALASGSQATACAAVTAFVGDAGRDAVAPAHAAAWQAAAVRIAAVSSCDFPTEPAADRRPPPPPEPPAEPRTRVPPPPPPA